MMASMTMYVGVEMNDIDTVRYAIFIAAKRGLYERVEVSYEHDDFLLDRMTMHISIPRAVLYDDEFMSGLQALEAGVPIDDLLA